MLVKVLGACCSNCEKLYKLADEAIKELGVDAQLQKVEDIQKIMSYGILKTPAIVVNEKVKAFGRVPGKEEIKKYIHDEL
jgi:small redox-active disulfide protein 2